MSVSNGTPALFHHDAQHRALLTCVGVSIALHALVLFVFPGFRPSAHPESSQVLTAGFELRPVPAEAVPSVHEPSRGLPQRRPEIQVPVPTETAAADPVVPQPTPQTPLPESSRPSVAPTAPAVASRAPEPPPSPRETVAKHDAFDADQLEKYRLAVIDAARRYKRYPAQAMDRGWQGRVEIRLVIGANGTIVSAIVKASSSYQILDDQALDMVKKSTGREPIPSGLRGREFSVDIPVIFELQTG